jgi:DnaJ-related protein SCJ1
MPIWQDQLENNAGEVFGDLHVEYVVVLPDLMEKAMEKDFYAVWDKYRKKNGRVALDEKMGRPAGGIKLPSHDEL